MIRVDISFSKKYQLKTLLIPNQSKVCYPTTKVLTLQKYFFIINYQAHVLINNQISVHVRMYTVYSCLSKWGYSIHAKIFLT